MTWPSIPPELYDPYESIPHLMSEMDTCGRGRARQPTPAGLGLDLDSVPASTDDGSRDVSGMVGQHNGSRRDRDTDVMRPAVGCPVGIARDFERDACGGQALLQSWVGAGGGAFGLAKGTEAKGGDKEERRNIHDDEEDEDEDW